MERVSVIEPEMSDNNEDNSVCGNILPLTVQWCFCDTNSIPGRRFQMKKMNRTDKVFLFRVADEVNDDGFYELKPFKNDHYCAPIDNDRLDEALNDVCNNVLDVSGFYEVIPKSMYPHTHPSKRSDYKYDECGNIYITTSSDDRIVIPDIIDKIDANPDISSFYVFVDKEEPEYCWVVAVYQRTIYSDPAIKTNVYIE